ncbi:MAG: hypothetical protein ACK6DQ_13610, partial [Planctomycetota bacterium]
LVMAMAAIHNRIRHMQDLVGSGLAQVLEAFKVGAAREEQRGVRQSAYNSKPTSPHRLPPFANLERLRRPHWAISAGIIAISQS